MAWYDVTGSVADWVMAGAAVYAAWKAKNWFKQRSNDDAYGIAKDIVVNNYREMTNLFSDTSGFISYFSNVIGAASYRDNKDDFVGKKKKIVQAYDLRRKLEDNIILIEKLGWYYKPEVKIIHDEFMNKIFQGYFASMLVFFRSVEIYDDQGDKEDQQRRINTAAKVIAKQQEELEMIIKQYNDFSKRIDFYFDIK